MKVAAMNWMQIEKYLERDDRAVVPVGSTEQHAYLSMATDNLLAERVAVEAAEPLGIPVFPVMPYGIAPVFRAYPGSISLRVETLIAVMRDVLDSLERHGFKRVLIVNGHGGNSPLRQMMNEWIADHPHVQVRLHDWWNAPKVSKKVDEVDPVASHASWMENFPWTRLEGVAMPDERKPLVDFGKLAAGNPESGRVLLGDGNFGGRYFRSDDELFAIWRVAVEEARDLMENGWGR
ncbi:MAG TPA: creatininase family protein [Candidatus Udaeobacter sp.]|jgi:creatinine amidohydrolase|nr:creatininase family protein [Candidatus Udaeobacter sp.]